MNRLFAGICLSALLLPAAIALAGDGDSPQRMIGTLSCNVVPHSGINLLIHSTSEIRCEFKPADAGAIEHYRGETGIGLGIDMNLNKQASTEYSVLARAFKPGTHQLSGKYSGAGGSASFGLSAGDTAPIHKNDGSISLQPIRVQHKGAGIAADFTYLYLEAESQK